MTENSRLIVIYSVRATQRQPLCSYTECVDDNMKPTKLPDCLIMSVIVFTLSQNNLLIHNLVELIVTLIDHDDRV